MQRGPQAHNLGKMLFGLFILALGVLFILDNLDLVSAHHYVRYWPVVLILYGLARLLQPRHAGGRLWGFFVAVVGGLLLLRNLHYLHFNLWALWPVLLVVIGLQLIWHAFTGRSPRRIHRHGPFPCPGVTGGAAASGGAPGAGPAGPSVTDESVIDDSVVLGGTERVNTSQDFRGGKISSIMGGYELDLRQASIAGGEAALELFVCCGAVEITVPRDWTVVVRGTPVLGGLEDSTQKTVTSAKRLVIDAQVIMGGVEVKN
jgi:predicted membrane protein